MADPALFIGVVSHAGTRFPDAQGESGLASQLAASFRGRGLDVVVSVLTSNLHRPDALPVDSATVQQTLSAEMRISRQWRRYLGTPTSLRGIGVRGFTWLRRGWQRLAPPAPSTVVRLINIELAHRDLMRQGLESGAAMILILEDDAGDADVADLGDGIMGLTAATISEGFAFVNLSASFSHDELGITHLLAPTGAWSGCQERTVLAAERPVSNTVCAIMYSRSFLSLLVRALDELPMEPVVPIDWKLNMALMRLHESGQCPPGACLIVEPAPIVQRSMLPSTTGAR